MSKQKNKEIKLQSLLIIMNKWLLKEDIQQYKDEILSTFFELAKELGFEPNAL